LQISNLTGNYIGCSIVLGCSKTLADMCGVCVCVWCGGVCVRVVWWCVCACACVFACVCVYVCVLTLTAQGCGNFSPNLA